MEYENDPPVLCCFSYTGLAAASEMEWNKEEEHPISRSESECNKIASVTFDWLDCPDLAQADTMDQSQIDTEMSILSFNTSHLPGGKVQLMITPLPQPKLLLQKQCRMKLTQPWLVLLHKVLRPLYQWMLMLTT